MVDGTSTTATTTTTHMLGSTGNAATSNTMASDIHTNDEIWRYHSSDTEDSDEETLSNAMDASQIRLPSGKTISRKANGPQSSRHRNRRAAPIKNATQYHSSRKVHGNCAMIPNTSTVNSSMSTSNTRRLPSPPTSDTESESEGLSSSHHHPSTDSLTPHIRLATHRTTIRSTDAQMLATLPVATQRTLLATARKAVERAGREEQEYRRKLDGYGNLKSKERFVNDVPGGRSHKNRFMAQ